MKLSEVPINPLWDEKTKSYKNEDLEEDIIQEIVFEDIEDNHACSEYAIVFGTSRKIEMEARVKKAVELYKKKRIQKMVFTGGKNGISNIKNNQTPLEVNKENTDISYLFSNNEAEAVRMKNYALSLGISEDFIITDCISNNSNETLQNICNFINIKEGDNLCLITSAYHLKRCLASAKKYIPVSLSYTLVAAETGYFENENYKKTTLGKTLINFEANHLVRLARENKIYDLELGEGLKR